MEVNARLLGVPQLRLADGSYDPPPTKATILLYYLAYKGGWCSRDELLYLFYPDTAEVAARSSLRQLLTSIRRLPYSNGLETEVNRLRWRVVTDVQAFEKAIGERQWLKATELYRGDLLEGCTLAGAPEFESWLEFERGELRGSWRAAALGFAGQLEANKRFAEAAELLDRLYQADPLDEAVLRRWVAAFHATGERRKALAGYEAFARTLAAELGGEPEEATLQLVERIKKGKPPGLTAVEAVVTAAQTVPAKPQNALPRHATPFIGRRVDRAKLAEQLGDPSCRLLTVAGPGGMGKTRLAAEVAATLGEGFADGTTFIPFASVGSCDLMVSAIADALAFAFFGQDEPKRQLLTYLRDKQMLLVLDNLEHLLEGAGLIAEILEAASSLTLLATSREPLNLRAEWVFDLGGLSYPPRGATQYTALPKSVEEQSSEEYDAIRLFVQSARRARADFVLSKTAASAVARICQLVEGLPLAVELAAGWIRLLPPEEIAAEIERGLDLLEAPVRDVPPRHRSLRAVFDGSWHLLTDREKQALRKLSVFRGGFTREAAEGVADVSLPLLLGLVNKSLLKATPSKQFERHPLVWQYSKEKAEAYKDGQDRVRDRHCAYYALLLHSLEGAIHGGEGQREAFSTIDREIADVRAAWSWAAERCDVNALALMLDSLQQLCYVRGRLREGEKAFTVATERLDEDSVTLSRLLVAQALFAWEQRRLDTAQVACERSIAMRKRLGAPPDARAYLHLGIVHVIKEDYGKAELLHHEGLAVARAGGDLYSVGCNLNMLAQVATEKGEVEKAERYYHESIAAFRERRDRWGLRMALTNLGSLLADTGRLDAAEACYRESLEHGREIQNLPGIAFTLLNLGKLSLLQENYLQAEAHYLESLAVYKTLEDDGMVLALVGLGETAHALQNHPTSVTYLIEALTTAIELGHQTGAIAAVVSAADLLLNLGEEEMSVLLLAFTLRQLGLVPEVKERAERFYERACAQLPGVAVVAIQHRVQNLKLEDIQKLLTGYVSQLDQLAKVSMD